MDSQTPVSILMPIKNGINFLPFAMTTILENARAFDEILLVDDGSEDGSIDFCRKWALADSRVCLISNPRSGLVSALNVGLNASANSLVARFDVDDNYMPTRIATQISQISSGDVAVFSDYNFTDTKGNIIGNFPSPVFPHATSVSLIQGRRTAHPSVLFCREAAIEAGGYREEDYLAEDLSLWLRLSRIGSLISIPETLLNYRIVASGISSSNRKLMTDQKNKIIQEIGVHHADIKTSIDKLKETLDDYQMFEHSDRRKFFHLIELKACLDDRKNSNTQIKSLLQVAIRLARPSFVRTSAGLIYEKFKRDQARTGA
jgi:glycosyltransferase involved in cell wall biosynthesis